MVWVRLSQYEVLAYHWLITAAVVIWLSLTNAEILFLFPSSVNAESEHYRRIADPSSPRQMGPQAYTVLDIYNEKVGGGLTERFLTHLFYVLPSPYKQTQ